MRRKFFRLLAAVAVLALTVTPAIAQPQASEPSAPAVRSRLDQVDPSDLQAEQATARSASGFGLTPAQIEKVYGPQGDATVNIIVQLAEPDVVNYAGGISGLAPSTASPGGRFNADTPAAQAYINYLESRHNQFAVQVAQVSASAKTIATYTAALNGVALRLPASDVIKVSQLPGVKAVFQDGIARLDTDTGPGWIEAPALWDELGGQELAGEGVVVGVIDGGAWSPNVNSNLLAVTGTIPSYADDSSVAGGAYTFPFTSVTGVNFDDYLGVCASVDPQTSDDTFACNDKVIGGYWFNTGNIALPAELDSPIDEDGHGTHTSSTAAGNVVTVTAGSTQLPISGVAPRARIVVYKACWNEDPDDPNDGGCAFVDTTLAVDQAILDGVNVLNYSIGGGDAVGGDSTELAFLNAREAGIFVAASAGNDGPDESTVGHVSPWVTTVAAMDHDRDFRSTLVLTSTFTTDMPDDLEGASATGSYTGQIILAPVQAGETEEPSLCNEPYAPGTFSGEIVVCRRGIDPRVEKGQNVLAGGAGGYVLVNANDNEGYALDPHWLPAVHLEHNATAFSDAGEDLVDYLLAAPTVVTATIGGGAPVARTGDVMAAFSSRGPTGINLIKPDLAAPGTAIFAGSSPIQYENYNPDGNYYQFQNGTSMASPHAAGAGALMIHLFPDWTPAEIQSALMTGAVAIVKEDGSTPADPFDQGSGRIDLSVSMEPRLTFDIPIADYEDVISGTKAIETLNYPSLANTACLSACAWTRTATNVMTSTSTYTWFVEAATTGLDVELDQVSYTVAADATFDFTVTADVSALAPGEYAYARLVLVENASGLEVVLPIAVVPTFGTLPTEVAYEVRRNAGSVLLEDITAIEITDLTVRAYGLVEAALTSRSLVEDPTNGDPYDNVGVGSFYITTTVPAGAKRLVAEVTAATSADIDMFVGLDADSDGPEESEEVALSATGAVLEYVSLSDPAPGIYWILVQNWTAGSSPDAITLATGVVPGSDAGNMTVTGPGAVAQLDPFDLRLFWDIPSMDAGDRFYGAFDLGPDAGNPGTIGVVAVDLARASDDVVKTASTASALAGDTVTYTITIQPNTLPEDLTYTLSDTIPAGMTYVPGSATGGAVVTGDTLTWSGTMVAPVVTYNMTTSNDDPNCVVPLANSGSYTDLQGLGAGINANPAISGDTFWFFAFSTGTPFEYWGETYAGTGIDFTDDGFAFFNSTPGATPWINEDIPTPGDPENVLAMIWRDMRVVYNAGTNRGVSLASLGGNTPDEADDAIFIEYDDVELFDDAGQRLDFELFMWRLADNSTAPEIIFAYDNISGTLDFGTVGVENADGTEGTKFAYDDAALGTITNGMAICFDWNLPAQNPHVITYAVTVDGGVADGAILTNEVDHTVDNPGSELVTESVGVMVNARLLYFPILAR